MIPTFVIWVYFLLTVTSVSADTNFAWQLVVVKLRLGVIMLVYPYTGPDE
jgi:hypothetical protein